MPPRSRFASRGAFDALATDEMEGQEEEEEVGEVDGQEPEEPRVKPESVSALPGKPSKGAKRRAAKERKSAAGSSRDVDSPPAADKELEVMTTRSGRSHPRASTEPRDEGPSSSGAQPAPPTPISHQEPIVEITKAVDTTGTHARTAEAPHGTYDTLKPPAQTFLSKASPSKGAKEKAAKPPAKDASADAKAFWKKVYERTVFGFLMIGGFIGAWRSARADALQVVIFPPFLHTQACSSWGTHT